MGFVLKDMFVVGMLFVLGFFASQAVPTIAENAPTVEAVADSASDLFAELSYGLEGGAKSFAAMDDLEVGL